MRAFVSIDLPDRLAAAVAAAQAPFADAPGVRPVDPGNAHLTLTFLGDVDRDRVPAVVEALETAVDDAGVEPFELVVEGYGAFPSLDYVSVVWAGVADDAGTAETTRLHEAIERETTALGFDPADHAFTPHVTLARVDDGRSKDLIRRVVDGTVDVGRFRVDEVRLTESTLDEDGPTYDTVARVGL
jgi:2'-5' RNA ligase